MEDIIRIEHLSKAFGDVKAVQDLSFCVKEGELFAFLGINGTVLLSNHMLEGVYEEMDRVGFPAPVVEGIKNSIDCNIYFFGEQVDISEMYMVMCITVLVLIGVYILINVHKQR